MAAVLDGVLAPGRAKPVNAAVADP